jgi:putative spermidine/putrescine transport system substrate-binding protein
MPHPRPRFIDVRFAALVPLLAVASFLALGCEESSATTNPEPVTLTVVSWGGAYQAAMTEAWFEPYAAENPHVTLLQQEPTNYAAIEAMAGGDVTWDVVDVENDFGLDGTAHLLEPIDCMKVPCDELQPERYQTTGYRVPVMLWGLVMAYRANAWGGDAPESWADFFDLDRFPGTRAVRRSGPGSGILEGALLADGVDPDALYPLDVERALAKLATIADHIVWWEDGQQCADLLAIGTAQMGVCYNGRVYDVQQAGAPVVIQWNGALIQADYLVVPRGSSNVAAAMDFIAYMTSAENNARLAEFISYAPANIDAVDDVPASIRLHLPSTYADVTIPRDDAWLDGHFDAVASRFEEWLVEVGAGDP